tara:strand:+ start:905 stop:1285 length:381 start_codon:yes stop_codon:yes gene_type:complete
MAHFAELDETNTVIRVIGVSNNELLDENGNEVEAKGVQFCNNLNGASVWVQTSYNKNFRKKYAGIGDTYDAVNDVFIEAQKFLSWSLNPVTFEWEPPIPRPADAVINGGNVRYRWDEATTNWVPLE